MLLLPGSCYLVMISVINVSDGETRRFLSALQDGYVVSTDGIVDGATRRVCDALALRLADPSQEVPSTGTIADAEVARICQSLLEEL